MLFASFDFLLFFLPVLAAWWALRHRPLARTGVVLAASYFFYGEQPPGGRQPADALVLRRAVAFSTVLDYVCSARIHHLHAPAGGEGMDGEALEVGEKNAWLVVSLVGTSPARLLQVHELLPRGLHGRERSRGTEPRHVSNSCCPSASASTRSRA